MDRTPSVPCSEEDGINYFRRAAITPSFRISRERSESGLNPQLGKALWVLAVDLGVTSTLTALYGTSGPWM